MRLYGNVWKIRVLLGFLANKEACWSTYKFPNLCNISTVKPICDIIYRFDNESLPVEDIDSDFYSRTVTLRGTSWRGKDCDDFTPHFHVGKKSTDDREFDTNCNGVFGEDISTGKSYEEQCVKELDKWELLH